MKVLITGGAGFIGANLVKFLLERESYHIRILDDLSVGRRSYIDQVSQEVSTSDRIEFIQGSILSREQIQAAVLGVDAVVHLAARTNVIESLRNPEEDFKVNAVGTLQVLESCRLLGVERFIYASSNAAVGEQDPPIDEQKVPAPIAPYGASKLAGEALCSAYYHTYGIQAITLRFANAYGPYSDHKTSVVARFIRMAREGSPLVIFGDGSQTRDFIHVRDVCQAIELALRVNTRYLKGESLVFQIATGRETRIIDLAKIIKDLAVQYGMPPSEIVFKQARKGEIKVNYSAITKARIQLGFQPQISLEDGLKSVWEHAIGSLW